MDETNRRPAQATASNGAIGNVIDSLNNACGQVAPHKFDNIPFEMKTYRQFVAWKFEDDGERKKPTKVPYDIATGLRASVANPFSWSSFGNVVTAYEAGGYAGIGFVLTPSDPYCFIDLDDSAGKPNHAEIRKQQQEIYNAFQSYAEHSPSGTGLHIICKGSVIRGAKREHIEIYSQSRFMTMTGTVLNPAPIIDENTLVNYYWYNVAANDAAPDSGIDGPLTLADQEVLAKAFSLANGAKFADIYNGLWAKHFPSQSEADFAAINIIQFSSRNRAQTQRIFEAMPSYRPMKYVNRPDLVSHMVARSFDRTLPPIDLTSLTDQLRAVVDAAKVAPSVPGTSTPSDELLPIVYANSFHGKPIVRRSWHVADMIPARTVTLFSGDGGTGKSLAALQLAFLHRHCVILS